MTLRPYQSTALTTAMAVLMFTTPGLSAAETHIVPLSELRQQAGATQSARTQNLRDLERVLSLPQAQEAMAKSKISVQQARLAFATLDDRELSQLAEKARAAEQDVEGGIIIGLLALIGLVVVIIIVVALVAD